MKISFLGATGTVTGSKYLLQTGASSILVDCGLFQGLKQLRLRNWAPFPVDVQSISSVVLTHAHLDHSGYLPLLYRRGFRGPVYCTPATRDLCAILLPDSGYLQEEEAAYANRHGFSKHKPALPLYTRSDAEHCLDIFRPVPYGHTISLSGGAKAEFLPAGHILGAAMVSVRSSDVNVLFSGDLGRPNDLIMQAPATVAGTDVLVIESTYGDRRHDPADPRLKLADVVNRTAARGGVVIVPAFAVARAQELMYYIHLLKASGQIPDVPVFLNSPMAINVARVYQTHLAELRLDKRKTDAMCSAAKAVVTTDESKALNRREGPMIIIAGSGMATGGRVIHHLEAFVSDPRNTVLFVGFQAMGTRGATLLAGAEKVKIHGRYLPVNAEIDAIDNLSAHADYEEILSWLGKFQTAPRKTFITHGEPLAADGLRRHIEETLHWDCEVPDYRDIVDL